MDETLGSLTTVLHPPKSLHRLMQTPPSFDRGAVGEASLALPGLHRRYIHIMVREKMLSLSSCLNLVVVELKFESGIQPGIIGEERSNAVVGVGVNRPVREDDIGLLGQQGSGKLLVTSGRNFRMQVDLVHENHASLKKGAGLYGVGGPPGGKLFIRYAELARDGLGVAVSQRKRHDLVSLFSMEGHGATAAALRIVHMSSYRYYLQLALRRRGFLRQHGRRQRQSHGHSAGQSWRLFQDLPAGQFHHVYQPPDIVFGSHTDVYWLRVIQGGAAHGALAQVVWVLRAGIRNSNPVQARDLRRRRQTLRVVARTAGSGSPLGNAVESPMRGRDGRPTAAAAARLSPSAAAEAPPYNGKQLWGRFSSRGHQKNFNQ